MLLGVVDPLGDLGPFDARHLVELRAELVEAILGQVGRLVVHECGAPHQAGDEAEWALVGSSDKGKNSRLRVSPARLKFDRPKG